MNQQAFEGCEKALGKDHLLTLHTMTNLAVVLLYQKKYEEAEEMNRRALERSEKALGKYHPDTFNNVGTLAVILRY